MYPGEHGHIIGGNVFRAGYDTLRFEWYFIFQQPNIAKSNIQM